MSAPSKLPRCITAAFNAMPDLHAAHTAFTNANGPFVLEKILKPLLLQYGLESTFGISLLYKYFDLLDDDLLLEQGRSSTPPGNPTWTMEGTEIYPCAWMITPQGTMSPYRCYNAEDINQKPVDHADPALSHFVHDFISCTHEHNLQRTIALRLLPRAGLIGSVELLANVRPEPQIAVVSTRELSDNQFCHTKQVSWFFDQHFGPGRYLSPCPCPSLGGQTSMGTTAGVQNGGPNWLPNHASEETLRAPEPRGLGCTVTRPGSDNGGKFSGPRRLGLLRGFTDLVKGGH